MSVVNCRACNLPLDAEHRDPFICNLCLKEVEDDLNRLGSDFGPEDDELLGRCGLHADSDATGFKE